MAEKSVTEIYIKAIAQTRGYAAARGRDWLPGRESDAFQDGAKWMLEQMREHYTMTPIASSI